MQNSENLRVATSARALAAMVYRETRSYPPEERYGLVSQMRRAAVSICSNIAEGCGRQGDRALAGFLYIAMGSASELQVQLRLSLDLEFLTRERATPVMAELEHCKCMLAALIKSLGEADLRARRAAGRSPAGAPDEQRPSGRERARRAPGQRPGSAPDGP